MKYLLTTLITISLLISADIENVAVLDFGARDVTEDEAATVSDYFRTVLVKQNAFKVLDRGNMQQILSEQELQASGCTDTDCAVEIGKLLNMQFLFTGTLAKFGKKYILTVNKISIESGQIAASEKRESTEIEKVLEHAKTLAMIFSGDIIRTREAKEREILKCPEDAKNMDYTCLGIVESVDDISGAKYGFAIYKAFNLDTGSWYVYFKSAGATTHINLKPAYVKKKAQQLKKERKDSFVWGSQIKPTDYNPRQLELRMFQEKGVPTEFVLTIVTRDKNRKAKEPVIWKKNWTDIVQAK